MTTPTATRRDAAEPESDAVNSPQAEATGRWARVAGYRDVLSIAIPLIISTSSWSLQQFIDRMFLAWHSPAEMAAALPAGLTCFSLTCFFVGTASYANVFVAQYHGAGRLDRIGPAIWQAAWFAVACGLALPLAAWPLGDWLFKVAGHAPEVRALEAPFFNISMLGSPAVILGAALSSFYSGRGKTWTMAWVNGVVVSVNVILDYGMIFGHWGFAERGIVGAAWATVVSSYVGTALYLALVMAPANDRVYRTHRGWRPNLALMKRLLKFGAPAGFQFMTDLLAFNGFILLVGRLGELELAATNVAFQVNTLAFMPMIGLGIATETRVGQWLGRGRPDLAERSTWSALHLTWLYMGTFAMLYLAVPAWFIQPFAAHADPRQFAPVAAMARVILRFVAFYCLFDAANIVLAAALKGAGDTRFVMLFALAFGWLTMVAPTAIAILAFGGGIYLAWTFLTFYVAVLGLGYLFRFRQGRWRAMRVIEHAPAAPPTPPDPDPTME